MSFAAGQIVTEDDFADLILASSERPTVRLVQATAQTVSHDTDTAITFGTGSTDIDTHNFHSEVTNPSRITPSVPGYYRLRAHLFWANDTDILRLETTLAKNAGVVPPRARFLYPTTNTSGNFSRVGIPVEGILSANGSSDYFEVYGRHVQTTSATLATIVGGSFSSVFECEYLRGL
jgi:hypothetical protein